MTEECIDGTIHVSECNNARAECDRRRVMQLTRYEGNPILEPTDNWWECKAVFNPAAVYDGGKVHILYRAVGEDNISRWGYASSEDGFEITYRSDLPVFEPGTDVELERLGVEDPRVVRIDGEYYITYVSASVYPAGHPRPAFSFGAPWKTRVCIARTRDFRDFERVGCVLPDIDDKDAVLFPEKIGGRYVMLHRIFPHMWICFSDDLVHWTDDQVLMSVRPDKWDSGRLGAGAPPIRTEHGWLEIYHAASEDRVYRLGAVLLDLEDPTKILARSEEPCFSPDEPYEKAGLVPNVVFASGIVEMDSRIIIYYGGADRVVGAAWADRDAFLSSC